MKTKRGAVVACLSISWSCMAFEFIDMNIETASNGVIEIEVTWSSGFSDKLEIFSLTNLTENNWNVIYTNIITSGATNFPWLDFSATNTKTKFYITGNAELDSDSDHLPDAREILIHKTDPEDDDTDNDLLLDGDELYDDGTHGDTDGKITDPLVPDNNAIVLPDLAVEAPDANLDGFAPFTPPVGNIDPAEDAPAISEWTRSGFGADVIAVSGNGTPTNYIAYAPGYNDVFDIAVWFGGFDHGSFRLPNELPPDEVYLLWPASTNGIGYPVRINNAELWWITDTVYSGGMLSIFGRNLGMECQLYIEESDEWLPAVSSNPYKADFMIPESYSTGEYTIWAHNGKGRKYGFSAPRTMIIETEPDWNEDQDNWFDVTDFGAEGDGSTDDWPAIEDAFNAADGTPWSTVYFPAGTYRIGSKLRFTDVDEIRIVGEGMDEVTIQPHENYSGISETWQRYVIQNTLENFEIKKMTLKSFGRYGRTLIRTENGSYNVTLDEVRLDQRDADVTYSDYQLSGDRTANFVTTTRIYLKNCEFYQKVNILCELECKQIHIDNCTFIGMRDAAHLLGIKFSSFASIINSTARNQDDTADEADATTYAQGRFVHGNGGLNHFYFGHNKTVNFMVREGYTDNQNTGEQVMFELMPTHYKGHVTDVGNNTVTMDNAPTESLLGMTLVVQKGGAQGQNRVVTGISGNTITVDEDWLVQPPSGSTIMIGEFSRRLALYKNHFDGRPRALNSGSGSFVGCAGIEPYGGCLDLVADANHFTEMRFPINVQSKFTGGDTGEINQPNFFNLYMNNTGVSNYHAFAMYVDKVSTTRYFYEERPSAVYTEEPPEIDPIREAVLALPPELLQLLLEYLASIDTFATSSESYDTPQLLGNVYRNNSFTNLFSAPLLYHGSFDSHTTGEQIDMQVFDNNTYINYEEPMIQYDKIEEEDVINQITIEP